MSGDMIAGLVIAGILLCSPILVLFAFFGLKAWEAWLSHKREVQRMEDRCWRRLEDEEED